MCFDEKNLILFKQFLLAETSVQRKHMIDMMIYDYMTRMYHDSSCESIVDDKKVTCSFETVISHMFFLVGHKLKRKYVVKKKALCKESYINPSDYEQFMNSHKGLEAKRPFSDFISLKPSMNDILKNNFLCQNYLHVQLHLIYYLVFIATEDNQIKSYHQVRPLMYNKISLQDNDPSLLSYKPLSILNTTLNFFSKNHKKHPNILESLTEGSIEILVHLIVLNYHYTNNIKWKFILSRRPIKTLQTMMMLQNQNKSNKDYTFVISTILSNYFDQSDQSIFVLIKLCDISGIPFDECKLLLKKIFINTIQAKQKYKSDQLINYTQKRIEKILNNFYQAIASLKDTNNTLKDFLIEVLMELFTHFGENDDNYLIFFLFFYKELLKKFKVKVNRTLSSFEYFKNDKSNLRAMITHKQVLFMTLMMDKFGIVIKKIFPFIICNYHKAFNTIFDIITGLNSQKENYYGNITQEEQNTRKVLMNYFTFAFDYIPNEILSRKLLNYFLKTNLNNQRSLITINYEDKSQGELFIENKDMISIMERIEYYASEIHKKSMTNSITNVLCYYPFNEVNSLCAMLQMLLDDQTNIDDENNTQLVTLDGLLINKEDEADISKSIEAINLYSSIYQKIIIEEIFFKLDELSTDDMNNMKNPKEMFLFALEHFHKINNENMIELCVNSLLGLSDDSIHLFTIEETINLLQVLNKLEENQDYSLQLKTLISETRQSFLKYQSQFSSTPMEKTIVQETKQKLKKLEILMKDIKDMDKLTIQNSFKIKKLIIFLSTNPVPNTTTIFNTIDSLFAIGMKLLKDSSDVSFYTSLSIKLYVSIYSYIRKNQDNRKYFFKLYNETLHNLLSNNKTHSKTLDEIVSDKLFEILVKIIKKIKKSTCFIAIDLLGIIFSIFDEYLISLTHLTIVSCLSICAYIIEYAHSEVYQYYNTIIKTGINMLSSNSSTLEIKRASAFLICKLLKHLPIESLESYNSSLFQAISHQHSTSKDNVLIYHLSQCLNYYS